MITIYFEASIPNNVNILLQVLKGNTDIIYMKVLSVQCHFFLRSHYTTIVVYECGNTNKHNILSWLQHADTGCGTAVLFTDYIVYDCTMFIVLSWLRHADTGCGTKVIIH